MGLPFPFQYFHLYHGYFPIRIPFSLGNKGIVCKCLSTIRSIKTALDLMHNDWVGRTYTVALLCMGGHLDEGYVAFLYSGLKKVNLMKVSLPYFEIFILSSSVSNASVSTLVQVHFKSLK